MEQFEIKNIDGVIIEEEKEGKKIMREIIIELEGIKKEDIKVHRLKIKIKNIIWGIKDTIMNKTGKKDTGLKNIEVTENIKNIASAA
jgi:hypothetical protein